MILGLVGKLLSTRRTFVVVLALGLFTMAGRDNLDPDFWWHLKTGQLIWETHSVPKVDPFSCARAGHPWVAHEWLSELFIYGLYQHIGNNGLVWVFAFLVALAHLMTYLRCPGRPYLAGAVTLWGAVASLPTWGVRPQMLSLLLAAVLLFLLDRAEENPRLVWLLPPLVLVWANLHAGYAAGMGFIALYLVGWSIEGWFQTPRASARRGKRKLLIAGAVSVVAALCNPNGIRLLWYPFETLNSRAMQRFITEWASPDFHQPVSWPLLALLPAAILALRGSPTRGRDVALLLPTSAMALVSIRLVPLFVIVAIPIVSRGLTELAKRQRFIAPLLEAGIEANWRRQLLHAVALAAVLIFAWVEIRQVDARSDRLQREIFPVAAADFLARQPTQGCLFNHYYWGGYLIWRLYPKYRVGIDGRADVYGDSYIFDFVDTFNARPGWQWRLGRNRPVALIVPGGEPLAAVLALSPDWKGVFLHPEAVVYVPAENQPESGR
jgi:hypothetical protein